jgi:hypothetical protein
MNGLNIAVARNLNSWLGIVGDLGGYHAEGFREETYLFGPRISKRLKAKSSIFGQVLVGGVHANAGARGLSSYTNGFATAMGGGLDFSINRRISIRAIQADYLQTHLGNSVQDNARIGAGIVFHFGTQ